MPKALFATRELALELLYAACSINETLFASESRVRVHRDITQNDLVFHAIDSFGLF